MRQHEVEKIQSDKKRNVAASSADLNAMVGFDIEVTETNDVDVKEPRFSARAIFDEGSSSIILQCGSWARIYEDPTEAADMFWAYLDQGQWDADVARFWDDFTDTPMAIDNGFAIDAANLSAFDEIPRDIEFVDSFLKRIEWNRDREAEQLLDDGFKVVDKNNPYLFRWYDNREEAFNDADVVSGSRRVVSCVPDEEEKDRVPSDWKFVVVKMFSANREVSAIEIEEYFKGVPGKSPNIEEISLLVDALRGPK